MKIDEVLPSHLARRTSRASSSLPHVAIRRVAIRNATIPNVAIPNVAARQSEKNATRLELDSAGQFVLYWTQSALRVDENAALDVAKNLATQFGLPLLVYQGVSSRYRYASDRHHTFILQAARDLQIAYAEQGIRYVCYLENDAAKRPLSSLIQASSIVVTEDLPTAPTTVFLRSISAVERAKILLVDTACILPMQEVGKAYTRAFAFRDATWRARSNLIDHAWPEPTGQAEYCDSGILRDIPAVDFQADKISDLVASCQIDHSIGPVLDTQGGFRAGYARWKEFLDSRIGSYARVRNNTLEYTGVSRMSAYLHYGMVAPTRLAREAHRRGGKGAEKYLDELLVWRELSYCYCKFTPNYRSWHALPDWARETLRSHRTDPRRAIYSWEQLSRGVTEDALWNAAQQSLLRHGELHNNLRMTWGKALINWCDDPRQALKLAIDLNHRYALDGRDPNSYGGILWCFGLFDRPFSPENPIIGSVRPRPTGDHARRLDLPQFRARVLNRTSPKHRVAIIGAGLSGAAAARVLSDHGLDVDVFEKSHGYGGRMATRRMTKNANGQFVRPTAGVAKEQVFTWDHGAQYFTARSDLFRRHVASWRQLGLVEKWESPIAVFGPRETDAQHDASASGKIEGSNASPTRYLGVPGMPAIAKHLLENTPTHLGQFVANIQSLESGVRLLGESGQTLGEADTVIVATVAPQVKQLVSEFDGLDSIDAYQLRPCWAALLALQSPLALPFGGAFVNDGPIRWFSLGDAKPGRSGPPTVTVHASADWSEANLQRPADDVARDLCEAFRKVVDGELPCSMDYGKPNLLIDHIIAHRWRYAIPDSEAHPCRHLQSTCGRVICAGDWLAGARVEGAFLSGISAASRILNSLPYIDPSKPKQLNLF